MPMEPLDLSSRNNPGTVAKNLGNKWSLMCLAPQSGSVAQTSCRRSGNSNATLGKRKISVLNWVICQSKEASIVYPVCL